MRGLILMIALLTCMATKGQDNKEFKDQGEQEEYWGKKFFEEKYQREDYRKYQGDIKYDGKQAFRYGENVLQVFDINPALLEIFSEGLLYNGVFIGENNAPAIVIPDSVSVMERAWYNFTRHDSLIITNIGRVSSTGASRKVKRFRCWLSLPGRANPIVYFFELTNERATVLTGTRKFIKGARLTFLKEGWIIL